MNPITLVANGNRAGSRFPVGRLRRGGGVATAASLMALLAVLLTTSGTLAVPTAEITNRAGRLGMMCKEVYQGEATTTSTAGSNGQVTSVVFHCTKTNDGKEWSCEIGGEKPNCSRNAPPVSLGGRGGGISAGGQVQESGVASDPPVVGDPVPRADGGETHQLTPKDDSQDAEPPAETYDGAKDESKDDDGAESSSDPGGQVIITTTVEEADDSTISGNG